MSASELDFYCREAISGRTAVDKLLESDELLAFRHTQPKWRTHIVVVPKRHVTSLVDSSLSDEDLGSLMRAVRQIASRVLAENGECRVVTNLGRFQDSGHLHWHIIAGDRLGT